MAEWLPDVARGLFAELFPAGFVEGWQLAAALLIGLVIMRTYGQGDTRRDAGRLYSAAGLAALFVFYGQIWDGGAVLTLLRLGATVATMGSAFVVERWIIDRAASQLTIPATQHPAVIFGRLGADAEFPDGRRIDDSSALGNAFRIVDSVDLRETSEEHAIAFLNARLESGSADTVILVGSFTQSTLARVIDTSLAHGCRLLSTPLTPAAAGVMPRSVWLNGFPLTELTAPGLKASQLAVKRFMDLIGATVGIVLLSPLLMIIAAWIRLDSPGPVLFRQTRLGRGGKPFPCLKFRTMRRDAEKVLSEREDLYQIYLENNFKIPPERDPRQTPVGRFLRRTSLDELPQLLNVFVGHMSLVGPRPIVPSELQHYEGVAALFLSLRPGMTGKWAVEGRSEVGYPDRAGMELEYIREWSLLNDLRILTATLPRVIGSDGAH